MLCPGGDGYYYNRRNYIHPDDELLGEGGFGSVRACTDLTMQTMFAMKTNNQSTDDKVESMKRECAMLNDIGGHENITQFLGAVIDDEVTACNIPQRVLKMMMELADSE